MAKLTKKQKAKIQRSIDCAEKAINYIYSDSTLVCRVDRHKGKPFSSSMYYNEDKVQNIVPTEKHYGSELCQIKDTLQYLKEFLEENS